MAMLSVTEQLGAGLGAGAKVKTKDKDKDEAGAGTAKYKGKGKEKDNIATEGSSMGDAAAEPVGNAPLLLWVGERFLGAFCFAFRSCECSLTPVPQNYISVWGRRAG
jgi:hypothetical protein